MNKINLKFVFDIIESKRNHYLNDAQHQLDEGLITMLDYAMLLDENCAVVTALNDLKQTLEEFIKDANEAQIRETKS